MIIKAILEDGAVLEFQPELFDGNVMVAIENKFIIAPVINTSPPAKRFFKSLLGEVYGKMGDIYPCVTLITDLKDINLLEIATKPMCPQKMWNIEEYILHNKYQELTFVDMAHKQYLYFDILTQYLNHRKSCIMDKMYM